jgi:hypothetical protein
VYWCPKASARGRRLGWCLPRAVGLDWQATNRALIDLIVCPVDVFPQPPCLTSPVHLCLTFSPGQVLSCPRPTPRPPFPRFWLRAMDLPEKGSHCALASCNVFDLLPIRCTACGSLFCKSHALRDDHACEAPGTPGLIGEPALMVARIGCEAEKCGNAALVKPAEGDGPSGWTCDSCRGVYCIS